MPVITSGLGLTRIADIAPAAAAPAVTQVAAHAPSLPTLHPGDRGPETEMWQRQLNVLIEAEIPQEGIYGFDTVAATEAFQRFFGLAVDGIAGAETRDVMTYVLDLRY